MVITLELPIRPADPLGGYARRFGALPAWFDEIPPTAARSLAWRALRSGTPLTIADWIGDWAA